MSGYYNYSQYVSYALEKKETSVPRLLLTEKNDKPTEILEDGTQVWRNKYWQKHRKGNKPAKIGPTGKKEYWEKGKKQSNPNTSSIYSPIRGGYSNSTTVRSYNSFIGGGSNNFVHGNGSAILAGQNNRIYGDGSAILAGQNNIVRANNSVILGGNGITLLEDNTVVGADGNAIGNINAENVIGNINEGINHNNNNHYSYRY